MIRNRYCLLAVLLLLAPGVLAQSMPSMEVELRPVRSSSEIRHAWKAAVENYPLRATRLDLSALSDKEQEDIQTKLSDPIKTYVGIGRDAHLTAANWAIVKQEDGFAIWQAQIHSAAALSLKVRFSDFDLGSGMSVKVYGLSGGVGISVGEYTGRGLGDGGKFWSLSALGDTVVVEYWIPAGREMYPDDFPFRVEKISHSFKDAEGKLSGKRARYYGLESCYDYNRFCVDDENFPEAEGVAIYNILDYRGNESQCSGSLLNNGDEPSDIALYFLTAFHCVEDIVKSSGAEANGRYISAEFWFHYDNDYYCGRTKLIKISGGARFVAGSTAAEGDWALLRIEKGVTDSDRFERSLAFVGWSSAPLEGRSRGLYGYGSYRGFRGHIFHHPGGRQMSFSEFDSEGLVDKSGANFYPCTGPTCSHFVYSVNYATYPGSSGAPLFYEVQGGARVVGVHTSGSRYTCGSSLYVNAGWGSRFSRMWQDERLQRALINGKNYNIYDGSVTLDPPVIVEGAEEEFSVDYGVRSRSISLNASADDASSLSWQLVSGSGPRRGSVRFTDRTGPTAKVVYEVSGGIRQEDQFSVRVTGAGGTDVIVITVIPIITNPPVIAEGSQDTVSVDYAARSVSFSLNASADDASSLNWQLVSGSGPRRGSVRFTDNTGSRAYIVYEVSGGIRQEDQFSIQVTGAGGTDVIVITVVPNIPDPPEIAEGSQGQGTVSVDYGARSQGFSLNASADDASSLSWQLVSGSGPRRGSVRFTDRTGSRADIVYEVSGGIRQEDQFSIQVRGAGGTDVIVITVVPTINPPVIAEGAEEEFRVDYGVRSRSFSLNASADDASSLSWRLVSGSGPRRGSVRFTDNTGSRADIVYEVSGGIRQEDQFSIQVTGAGGTDVITVRVVPNIDPPVITEGREKEFQVDYGDRSLSFSLTAEADDASFLNWQLVSGSGSRQGNVRFTDNTGSRADIVYEVSGGIRREDQFSVQVMGGGGTDVIVVKVVPIKPPEILGGTEKVVQVDYGVRSRSFSLTARSDYASSLSWRLLANSGPGVRRSSVSFPTGQGAEARVVYEVSGGIKEPDRFSVQVSGRGGSDVVDVRVVIVPVIVEGNEEELSVASGSANGVLPLNAKAVGSNFLRWQLVPGSGPQQGDVRFTDSTGPTAGIVYEVSDGIRQKDQFVVRVGYGAQVGSGLGVGGSDEITILVMPDVPPVVTRVFGREVDGDDELTVYISPQTREVNLDVIAFDESPEKLKWTITGGAEASLNGSPMGGKEIVVSYRRSSEGVKSSSFLITVTDRFEQPDLFVVRMVEDGTTPVIVNEDVMTTESGKTLEVKIPYRSEQLILGLVTNSARAGLRGELVDSIPTPPTVSASFPQAAGEGGLKVDLQVPQSVDGALFRIRVSNGSANEEITIRVERELIIPVRSKVLLGGATR